MKKIIIILAFTFGVQACDMFSTRNPEDPNTGQSSFIPPTSPEIVITNLQNAILEKNAENYISCFTDSVPYLIKSYVFTPTADANSKYPSLFSSWNLYSERQYFISLVSAIPNELSPRLTFSENKFDLLSTDSAVYKASYYLNTNHSVTSTSEIFAGKLYFTLFPDNNGLWAIGSWIDLVNENDTISVSWSNLKALFGS